MKLREHTSELRAVAVLFAAFLAVLGTSGCASRAAGGRADGPLAISPKGDDGNSCTVDSPCRSFNHAYGVAQLGQTVEVEGGTYPSQDISGSKTGSGRVIFAAAPGATATIDDELNVHGANHIEFDRIVSGDYQALDGSDDIVFRDNKTKFFFFRSSSNISILGGSVGGGVDVSPTIGATYQSKVPSTNIVIDGVLFHDVKRSPGNHIECLFVQETDGLTIRNSRFRNCDVMDVYFNDIGVAGGPPRNVTIENNVFAAPGSRGYYSLFVRWDRGEVIRNYLIRNNSFTANPHFDPGRYSNFRVIANVGPNVAWGCPRGVLYAYNVWDGARCGASDTNAPSRFRNPSGLDLRPEKGAASINHGDPKSFPRTDIFGRRRPRGPRPDAGAYETA